MPINAKSYSNANAMNNAIFKANQKLVILTGKIGFRTVTKYAHTEVDSYAAATNTRKTGIIHNGLKFLSL